MGSRYGGKNKYIKDYHLQKHTRMRTVIINRTEAKTRQQIANEYGIDRKTLYCWLKRSKLELSKGLLSPAEVRKVYDTFGHP